MALAHLRWSGPLGSLWRRLPLGSSPEHGSGLPWLQELCAFGCSPGSLCRVRVVKIQDTTEDIGARSYTTPVGGCSACQTRLSRFPVYASVEEWSAVRACAIVNRSRRPLSSTDSIPSPVDDCGARRITSPSGRFFFFPLANRGNSESVKRIRASVAVKKAVKCSTAALLRALLSALLTDTLSRIPLTDSLTRQQLTSLPFFQPASLPQAPKRCATGGTHCGRHCGSGSLGELAP
jgi:hypothetical protein